eukprot:m.52459 g.52459  ORF g.52459 m.52459 type:complete len:318 (-) comp10793_c0_seq1:171-1124(-)
MDKVGFQLSNSLAENLKKELQISKHQQSTKNMSGFKSRIQSFFKGGINNNNAISKKDVHEIKKLMKKGSRANLKAAKNTSKINLAAKPNENAKDAENNNLEEDKGRLAQRLPTRNSEPNLVEEQPEPKKVSRSATSPTLVKFLPTYVNRFKACPFSLGEKISRWCHTSAVALFDGHPPEDHFITFPPAHEYRDIKHDKIMTALAAGEPDERIENEKERVEVILTRYPAGQHGLTPYSKYFSSTEKEEKIVEESHAAVDTPTDSNNEAPEGRSPSRASVDSFVKSSVPLPRSGTQHSLVANRGSVHDLLERIPAAIQE